MTAYIINSVGAVPSAERYVSVEVVSSSAAGGTYATSGTNYVPLVQAAADNVSFEVAAPVAGTMKIRIPYAMSVANSGNVRLQLSKLVIASGGDPNAALSASTAFTLTPGNDANRKMLDENSDASLSFAVAAGDVVRVKLERPTTSDTHTGDMRLLKIYVVIA